MSDDEKQKWIKQIVNRMMVALKVDSQKSLAVKLGIGEKSASNWIQKRSVPWPYIYSCHLATGKSLDWLYSGKNTPVEITPTMYKAIESATQDLLHSGEKMTIIKVQIEQARDLFVTGMVNSFLDITNPNKVNLPDMKVKPQTPDSTSKE